MLWKIQPNEIKGFFANDIISSPSKVRGDTLNGLYFTFKLIIVIAVELGQCRLVRVSWL